LYQEKLDVTDIISPNNKVLVLNSAPIINSNGVTLLSGKNTSYICDYDGGYKSVLNLTSSQSFNISGGVLNLGDSSSDTTLYFIGVSSTAYLTLFSVDVRFIGKMNNVIYITGGTICIEKVKINKQSWVYPLIEIHTQLETTIEFLSSNITNCIYWYNEVASPHKSAIIFITNTSSLKVNMTILSSSFLNNRFNLSRDVFSRGSACHFYGPSVPPYSCIIIIFFFNYLTFFSIFH
jgi:hypothetical protein